MIKYEKYMEELWKLAGEIGTIAESEKDIDGPYTRVYRYLSKTLDIAEEVGLINSVSEKYK